MTCQFIYQFMIKKPRKVRALTCTLTVEEKRQRACNIAKKHYYNHHDEICAKHALYRESVKSKIYIFLNKHFIIIII